MSNQCNECRAAFDAYSYRHGRHSFYAIAHDDGPLADSWDHWQDQIYALIQEHHDLLDETGYHRPETVKARVSA